MAAMSNWLENQLIDHIFRSATFTKPTTLAVALCWQDPTDAGTTLSDSEMYVGSTGYARAAINPSDTNWYSTQGTYTSNTPSTGTSGATSNAVDITFAEALQNWKKDANNADNVRFAALTNSTTQNESKMLFYGSLANPKTVNAGDIFVFSKTNFAITLDN